MKDFKIGIITTGLCEDCGFYNDCPAGYRCPPLEIIAEALKEIEDKKDD